MLNHARTLLLNVKAPVFARAPGEEYIPPDYTPVSLPGDLQLLRGVLFGQTPDRSMLNYRAAQLMQVLHSTPLEEFVRGLDPRITYDPSDSGLFAYPFNQAATTLYTGDPIQAVVAGSYLPAADVSGVSAYQWNVAAINATQLAVWQTVPTRSLTVTSYTVTDGVSSDVPLAGTGLTFQFNAASISAAASDWTSYTEESWTNYDVNSWYSPLSPSPGNPGWIVSTSIRPSIDLGQIVASLQQVAGDVMANVFAAGTPLGSSEPFQTFSNLWNQHPELLYKLGGLLLAVIYQTDRLRGVTNG